jgi:hypothetical protein
MLKEFFADAGEREFELRALDTIIRETVPELAADRRVITGMSFPLLAYGMYHYKYASGREGDWPAVGMANQKNYISLYICALEGGSYLAEAYGKRLGKVNVGKSCIRFKKLDDLNVKELVKILEETEEWWHEQPKPEAK